MFPNLASANLHFGDLLLLIFWTDVPIILNMSDETLQHFKYEIALGSAIPMPKPKIDYYPNDQYTVQQYLHTLCKVNVGALGKVKNKWRFGEDAPPSAKLGSRPDIREFFDFAEKLGIIEPAEGGDPSSEEFTPYKLTEAYWDRFDKFVQ